MSRALVRRPGPLLADGLLTHQERVAVGIELAQRQWQGYVEVDISEFEKLEGCVTCLSVRYRG